MSNASSDSGSSGAGAAVRPRRPSVEDLLKGLQAGDRTSLARAITLVESTKAEDREIANRLLEAVLRQKDAAERASHRIGVSGVPGAGKSTLIESLGGYLTSQGHKVAVLAVDPSSSSSGGSILGDKTRMEQLARNPMAFVRPSPSRGNLGGVERRSREAILLCEAAGYGVTLVETVGVGQSETTVAELVDCSLVLMISGAGDELQGIKRGILEIADLLVINKADGDNLERAKDAQNEYRRALTLMQARHKAWKTKVTLCSALENTGVSELWQLILEHRQALEGSGEWESQRKRQRSQAVWRSLENKMLQRIRENEAVQTLWSSAKQEVEDGRISPDQMADDLLKRLEEDR